METCDFTGIHLMQQAALEGREAMFQDIDWCQGQWCPLPRPTLTDEDRAVIAGYGLECYVDEDAWLGLPQFEGVLASIDTPVSLCARLVAREGEFTYEWRLRATRSALLDGLPYPLIVDSEDPLAALAEAVISGERGVNDLIDPVPESGRVADTFAHGAFKRWT